jgi:spermidine synthase
MAVYKERDGDLVREYALQEGKPIWKKRTQRAMVEVVPTKSYGTALFIDNELQLTEKDEYIYHEQ